MKITLPNAQNLPVGTEFLIKKTNKDIIIVEGEPLKKENNYICKKSKKGNKWVISISK